MADANEVRDWRIYADFAGSLIGIARRLYTEEPFGVDLEETVYALDSTTIDLCLSVFPWAHFRSTKAAVKMHTLLDLRGAIPSFIHISDGKLHDVNVLDVLIPELRQTSADAVDQAWRTPVALDAHAGTRRHSPATVRALVSGLSKRHCIRPSAARCGLKTPHTSSCSPHRIWKHGMAQTTICDAQRHCSAAPGSSMCCRVHCTPIGRHKATTSSTV